MPVRALLRTPRAGPWDEHAVAELPVKPLPSDLMTGVDTVYHLAAKVHAAPAAADEADYFDVNVEGTRCILDAAVAGGVRRFVFMSSVKAGGEGAMTCHDESAEPAPETAYGRSKLEAERLVSAAGWDGRVHTVNLRPPLVYGAGVKGNLASMLGAIDQGFFPPIAECGNRRSMIHVEDVAHAAILAGEATYPAGATYVLTDGPGYSTREIYDAIRDALGRPAPRWSLPIWPLRAMARAGDLTGWLLGRSLGFDSSTLDKLLGSAVYSSARIERELGFRPARSLTDALPVMIECHRRRAGAIAETPTTMRMPWCGP